MIRLVAVVALALLAGCEAFDRYAARWYADEAAAFVLGRPPYMDASCDGECASKKPASPFIWRGARDAAGCHCEPMGRW